MFNLFEMKLQEIISLIKYSVRNNNCLTCDKKITYEVLGSVFCLDCCLKNSTQIRELRKKYKIDNIAKMFYKEKGVGKNSRKSNRFSYM